MQRHITGITAAAEITQQMQSNANCGNSGNFPRVVVVLNRLSPLWNDFEIIASRSLK